MLNLHSGYIIIIWFNPDTDSTSNSGVLRKQDLLRAEFGEQEQICAVMSYRLSSALTETHT